MIALHKSFQILKKIVSPIFVIVALYFWIYYIIKYYNNISQVLGKIDWLWFCVAMVFFIPFYAIEILNWELLLKVLKEKVSFFNAGKSWLISNLAKYIPGTIWIPLSRGYVGKEEKVSYITSIVAWIFELYFHIAVSACIFCGYLISVTQDPLQKLMYGLICLILILIPFFKNYLFEGIRIIMNKISFLHKKITKFNEIISILKTIPHRIPIMLFISTLMIYVLQGIWLYVLTYSVVGISYPFHHFLYIWSFSWFIGFIIIFSPGGFGVREGIMVSLLTKIGIAVPYAMVIALLSRFQYVILDGIVTFIFLKIFKKS